MSIHKNFDLNKIIDINLLQTIQNKFSHILNLSTITVDEKGTPLVSSSNFSSFCTLIRSSKEGRKRCFQCDAKGGFKAMQSRKPVIYSCHAGLTDVAAPIIVDDNYLGCMLCGQVMTKGLDNTKTIDVNKLSKELNLPKKSLLDALSKVSVWKYEDIIEASDFLFLFSNFIAKTGVSNITSYKLLEKEKEKNKLEKLLNDTEIKALRSQINPHFLFNTLNTIARMALIEEAPKTEELVYALSDILRYSIKNSENMVSIKTELNYIKKYLYIQKQRFGKRINYDMNIDENTLNYKIPVLTLQPLVENSIIHGLEYKKTGGTVNINVNFIDTNCIHIQIIDDGIGINKTIIDSINKSDRDDTPQLKIGIQNVKNRLIYYFGPSCIFKIESDINKFTKISIKIPCIL